MPSTVNLYLIGVWFCVGFFYGCRVGCCGMACGPDIGHYPYLT